MHLFLTQEIIYGWQLIYFKIKIIHYLVHQQENGISVYLQIWLSAQI